MARAAASYQGFYRTTSVVRLEYYSYFMTTKETVKLLSQVSGEVILRDYG